MIPWDNVTISARAPITKANKRLRSLTVGAGRHGMAVSRGLVAQNGRCIRCFASPLTSRASACGMAGRGQAEGPPQKHKTCNHQTTGAQHCPWGSFPTYSNPRRRPTCGFFVNVASEPRSRAGARRNEIRESGFLWVTDTRTGTTDPLWPHNQISNNRRGHNAGARQGQAQSGFDAAAVDEATPTTGRKESLCRGIPRPRAFPAAAPVGVDARTHLRSH